MSIETECDACGRAYRVKDDYAGKKFRCKTCDTVVQVPEPVLADADPWDDLDSADYEDYDNPYSSGSPPPRTIPPVVGRHSVDEKRAAKSPKKRQRKRHDGMPTSIILAAVCIGILISLNGLGAISLFAEGELPKALGSGLRMAIEVVLLVGILQRQDNARKWAVGLAIFGAVAFFSCGTLVSITGPAMFREADVAAEDFAILVAVFFAQFLLDATIAIGLLMPSAKEYCHE